MEGNPYTLNFTVELSTNMVERPLLPDPDDENISMRFSLTLVSALWSRETSCHWTGGGAVGSWAHNSSQLLPTLD